MYLITGLCLVDRYSAQTSESQTLEQVSCIGVNLDGLLLQGRNLGNKVQSAFALLLLQFKRDTTDGSLGNSAHQVRCVSSNLVAHALGWKDGNFIDNTLVGVEVDSESSVVLLDDGASTLLNGLGTDSLKETNKEKCT